MTQVDGSMHEAHECSERCTAAPSSAEAPRAPIASMVPWQLEAGQARWLGLAQSSWRLQVMRGRLWVTGDGLPGDVWLEAGEGLDVPAGRHLLVESWPAAECLALLRAPAVEMACPGAGPIARGSRWLVRRWRRVMRRAVGASMPTACCPSS